VVHGGPHLADPVAITPDVHAEIQGVSAFAPLHIQAELEGVNIIEKILGDCSAGRGFRYGISPANARSSDRLSGPYEWFKKGIRRYGFHGINHQYCTVRAGQLLGKNPKSLKLSNLPFGQWLLDLSRSARPQHRHDYGLHSSGWADDGDAVWGGGPRNSDSSNA
jgi:acetate kinase